MKLAYHATNVGMHFLSTKFLIYSNLNKTWYISSTTNVKFENLSVYFICYTILELILYHIT